MAKSKTTTKLADPSSPALSHPPYFQMISEAISSLKDRSGSSQPAIAKFVEEKYESLLLPNFRKTLSVQLKKLVKSEKLVKVKNSYKVSSSSSSAFGNVKLISASSKSNRSVEKVKVIVKGEKTKRLSQVKTPDALKKKSSSAKKENKGSKKLVNGEKTKTKRLSQVKTPEGLKRKRGSISTKTNAAAASRTLKSSKANPKKARV